jgi:hypothetical protein
MKVPRNVLLTLAIKHEVRGAPHCIYLVAYLPIYIPIYLPRLSTPFPRIYISLYRQFIYVYIIHTHIHTQTFIYIYIYIYIYTYIYIYIYIYRGGVMIAGGWNEKTAEKEGTKGANGGRGGGGGGGERERRRERERESEGKREGGAQM